MSVHISDHACLRYLERVRGIDMDQVRREIASRGVETTAVISCDTVILGTGHRVKLVGADVVTVLSAPVKRRRG